MLLHSLRMGVLPANATPFLPGKRFSRVIYPRMLPVPQLRMRRL